MIYAGADTDAGVPVTATSAMKSTAVYACVQVIAESVAQLPLILYKRLNPGKKRAIEHRLYNILHDRPNSFQTAFEWWATKTIHVLLYGAAYDYIIRNSRGDILELLPIHPTNIRIEQDSAYKITYQYTDLDGNYSILKQNQIFRAIGMSLDGFSGVSPITYHRQTFGVGIAADKHTALTLKNGAKFAGILKHPGKLRDADVARRVRESFDEASSGSNVNKTPLLEEGMTWQQVSMTNVDAQYIETRKFQITDIARIFRVPPHKIGDLERSTNNNIEHQGLEFVTNTLVPWLKRYEQAIARDLLQYDKKYFAEFLVDGLLRGDSTARAAYYSKAVGGPWMSPNEARVIENMNPIDGYDKILEPLNMGGKNNEKTNS